MQYQITRSYIYDIQTGKYLTLEVPSTFRYGRGSTVDDLPLPSDGAWSDEPGTDFGNQVEDVIYWLHRFSPFCVNRQNKLDTF